MCTTCGCSDDATPRIKNLETGKTISLGLQINLQGVPGCKECEEHAKLHEQKTGHDHDHAHDHSQEHTHDHSHEHAHDHSHDNSHEHAHDHSHDHGKDKNLIVLEKNILAKNNALASENRSWFSKRGITAINLTSSPGSGKTTLLERTITDLRNQLSISVIEGDQETVNDAERIRATGCKAIQINTGAGCHLEADMLARALDELKPEQESLLFIENVGNLVCPALFDLGEDHKVCILSVTEGDDKPLKYPHMFRASNIMLINKIDLLPYVKFDVHQCKRYAESINPQLKIFELSATSGQGLKNWYEWLRDQVEANTTKRSLTMVNK